MSVLIRTVAAGSVAPLAPTGIPMRLPFLPAPRRNVCWLLAEMRSFYESAPWRWTTGTFRRRTAAGSAFCVLGLAYHLCNGDRKLAREAVDYIATAIGVSRMFRHIRVMTWNDDHNVTQVIAALRKAEQIAEARGACEP